MSGQGFRERVMAAIAARGWSMREAARQAGVSYNVVRELHRRDGSSTSAENAAKLARALNLEEAGLAPVAAPLLPIVPVGCEASKCYLGLGAEVLEDLTHTGPRHLASLRIHDDAMTPTLNEGDLVIVDRSRTDTVHNGLFAVVIDGVLQVRRFGWAAIPGTIRVLSDSRSYPVADVPAERIEVVGRVVWAGGAV